MREGRFRSSVKGPIIAELGQCGDNGSIVAVLARGESEMTLSLQLKRLTGQKFLLTDSPQSASVTAERFLKRSINFGPLV